MSTKKRTKDEQTIIQKHEVYEVTIQTMTIDNTLTFEVLPANGNPGDYGIVILRTGGVMSATEKWIEMAEDRNEYECMAGLVAEKYNFTRGQVMFEVMASVNRIK